MSPVSRKRKKKPPTRGAQVPSAGPRHRATRYDRSVAPYRELLDATPLEVEVFTSGVLGLWWAASVEDGSADTTAAELVDAVGARPEPDVLAVLRAFAALATDGAVRRAATTAADALAAAGVPEPSWVSALGPVPALCSYRVDDPDGAQASLVVEFARDADRHALVALLDADGQPGPVRDAWFTTDPDTLRRDLSEQVASSAGRAVLTEQPPGELADVLRRAFALVDDGPVPDSEEFGQFRALALARLRSVPDGQPDGPA